MWQTLHSVAQVLLVQKIKTFKVPRTDALASANVTDAMN